MLTRVLVVVAVIVAVTCEDYYRLKLVQHEAQKEYGHHPHHEHIPVRVYHETPANEEHHNVQEPHGHAYSSQSIVHHGQAVAYEESQESNAEHVAPVYQYVDENNEEQQDHPALVQHKFHIPVQHYPAPVQHEIAATQAPSAPSHYQPHEVQIQSHGAPVYHHEMPHNAPQHAHYHHEVPVHHLSESHESHDEPIDYYAYPKYQYEYKVEDPHTGDNKFQHEIRDGDVVKGIYGLHEADGSFRTVEYSSDKHTGFNAIVKHSAPGQHVHIESHHQN